MCAIEMNHTFKKLVFLVTCTFVFFGAQAQYNRTPIEDMSNAIKNNRVADIAKYFDNFVPVTINNNQAIYSRNQAEVVLRDFFDKNTPKDFNTQDNGSPDNTSKFLIGNFNATNGSKFNVYILIKMKDGNYILQDIKLNKE
jgi:uncharacterized protein DUF4783